MVYINKEETLYLLGLCLILIITERIKDVDQVYPGICHR
jgi:hypothetical protein